MKKDENVEVDSLSAGLEGIKQFMGDVTDLDSPEELKDIISAPGAFVLPVAIYQ